MQKSSMAETLESEIPKDMVRWSSHPWEMIKDGLILTLDQTDLKTPIKPFPKASWLQFVADEWYKNSLLAVPKSRRMMLTWLMCWTNLWLAMFHEGAACFLVSEKEGKSAELVQRCEFMFDHIPEARMLKPKMRAKYFFLEVPRSEKHTTSIP